MTPQQSIGAALAIIALVAVIGVMQYIGTRDGAYTPVTPNTSVYKKGQTPTIYLSPTKKASR